MDLLIKRFSVRYQGSDFGPGSVLYDVEAAVAAKLVAESNGEIEALPSREEAAKPKAAAEAAAKSKAKGKAAEAAAEDEAALPSVDPAATVK